MKINKKKIIKKDFQWNHKKWTNGYRYEGVHTFEGKLVWYSETYPAYGSVAQAQSFEDFLINGSPIENVPDTIIEELTDIIKKGIEE